VAAYFADTSFWIGLSSKRDQYHYRSVAWYRFIVRTRSTIVTSEAVLLEWLNAMADVSTRRIAAEGCVRVRSESRITVVAMEAELLASAIDLYRGRLGKDWSLTDCMSFVIMGRRGIADALTTDHHYKQAGFGATMLSLPGPVDQVM
jgi:predicted nucleic acid-binding protein